MNSDLRSTTKIPAGLIVVVAIGTTIMVALVGWTVWVVNSFDDPFVPAPRSSKIVRDLCNPMLTFLEDARSDDLPLVRAEVSKYDDKGLNDRVDARAGCLFFAGSELIGSMSVYSSPPSFEDRMRPPIGDEVLGSYFPTITIDRHRGFSLQTVRDSWDVDVTIYPEAEIGATPERIDEAADLLIQLTEDLRE
ncbi:hypothetical protein ACHIPZ_01975 [Antrihabitans sp. NCIMB 15449]|uniref:DUF3558 domain-containing protein n=1 Tax=Antrihabitans spumae TaxID=3373370 RepID=A0ABW7JGE5_9NOCA